MLCDFPVRPGLVPGGHRFGVLANALHRAAEPFLRPLGGRREGSAGFARTRHLVPQNLSRRGQAPNRLPMSVRGLSPTDTALAF